MLISMTNSDTDPYPPHPLPPTTHRRIRSRAGRGAAFETVGCQGNALLRTSITYDILTMIRSPPVQAEKSELYSHVMEAIAAREDLLLDLREAVEEDDEGEGGRVAYTNLSSSQWQWSRRKRQGRDRPLRAWALGLQAASLAVVEAIQVWQSRTDGASFQYQGQSYMVTTRDHRNDQDDTLNKGNLKQ